MIAKGYPVQMEVDGKRAMWERPDTGDTPISYIAPPMSSAKGLFDSISFLSRKEAVLWPYKVEVCSPIVFDNYNFNCTGVGRKTDKNVHNTQTFSQVLSNVCYRIYGISFSFNDDMGKAHFLQDLFLRRLKKGQSFTLPFLGQRHLGVDYYGPFRETTQVVKIKADLGPMPLMIFKNGKANPVFCSRAILKDGVLEYGQCLKNTGKNITIPWDKIGREQC